METELRDVLKPQGPVGNLFRPLLFLRVAADLGRTPRGNRACPSKKQRLEKSKWQLHHCAKARCRVLVTGEEREDLTAVSGTVEALEPDTFRRLALIARYDRAASKEMYRTLGLLILMRDGGESGLASGIRAAAGIKAVDGEEK